MKVIREMVHRLQIGKKSAHHMTILVKNNLFTYLHAPWRFFIKFLRMSELIEAE